MWVLIDFFLRFSDPETQLISAILQLWSFQAVSYDFMLIGNTELLPWPDGGNGNFHCSSSFLKASSLIFEAQLSFTAHQNYTLSSL